MNNPTPLVQQGWLRAALFTLIFFIGAVSIGLLMDLFADVNAIFIVFAGTVFSVALAVLFRKIVDRRSVRSMGFQWDGYQHHAAIGFCLGMALLGIGTLILYAHKNVDWNAVVFPGDDLFIALVLMILVALGEEMVFRGYILRNLLHSMSKWLALIVSALIFAAAHAGNPGITTLAAVNLVLGGLLLGLNYIYTRNLWFALLFHLSWNFFQGPVLGFDVSGLDLQSVLVPSLTGPQWLTGGLFGFEGSIVSTMVLLAAIIGLYLAYENKYKL